jgi:hypothetical protein
MLLGVDLVTSLTAPSHPGVIKLHINMSASRPLLRIFPLLYETTQLELQEQSFTDNLLSFACLSPKSTADSASERERK